MDAAGSAAATRQTNLDARRCIFTPAATMSSRLKSSRGERRALVKRAASDYGPVWAVSHTPSQTVRGVSEALLLLGGLI